MVFYYKIQSIYYENQGVANGCMIAVFLVVRVATCTFNVLAL